VYISTACCYLFSDNVVQIGSDFQAEIPDCISGTGIIFRFILIIIWEANY